jgi:hypothetical protein
MVCSLADAEEKCEPNTIIGIKEIFKALSRQKQPGSTEVMLKQLLLMVKDRVCFRVNSMKILRSPLPPIAMEDTLV